MVGVCGCDALGHFDGGDAEVLEVLVVAGVEFVGFGGAEAHGVGGFGAVGGGFGPVDFDEARFGEEPGFFEFVDEFGGFFCPAVVVGVGAEGYAGVGFEDVEGGF